MKIISNSASAFWWLIVIQSFLCIGVWSVFELFGSVALLIVVLAVSIGGAASYNGFYLAQPLKNRICYAVLGQVVTVLNVIVFGLVLGQLVAMFLGIWSFPLETDSF